MEINSAIKLYASFLNCSWQTVIPLLVEREYTSNESSISDWCQSNWELLVERKVLSVNEYLEIYGEGADFNGASSRITDIDVFPTHGIKVKSCNKKNIYDLLNDEWCSVDGLDFDRLVGFKDGFYKLEPDYKYALLEDKSGVERVFALEDVKFELFKL